MSKSKQSAKRISWAWEDTKPGWKGKEGKIILFSDMTDSQLSKYYKLAQHKELVYMNKLSVFLDKKSEIEEEAERRKIHLASLDTTLHSKKRALSSS
jgi:hypothetical protein